MGIPARWGGFGGNGVHPRVGLGALSAFPMLRCEEMAGERGRAHRSCSPSRVQSSVAFFFRVVQVQKRVVALGLGEEEKEALGPRSSRGAAPFLFLYFLLS